jgi:hypothetical protein
VARKTGPRLQRKNGGVYNTNQIGTKRIKWGFVRIIGYLMQVFIRQNGWYEGQLNKNNNSRGRVVVVVGVAE